MAGIARQADTLPELVRRLSRIAETEPGSTRLRLCIDLAALVGLSLFAWVYAGFWLRDDLYLYGDHPGQFYRLWHMVNIIWPEEGRFIGWSPYWFAGWPELQFYPPGFVLLGWLIWMASFNQLPLFLVYQIIVFLSFLLPAINFYLLLALGLQDRLAGLAAGWMTMAMPVILGGPMMVVIGMSGERLAFGMVPLLILSGLWLMQSRRKILPWLATSLVLTAVMLLHPYQALLPAASLGLYALFRSEQRWQRLGWLSLAAVIALALTAFWWLPVAMRRALFIPVVEAPMVEIQSHFNAMWLDGTGWLLAAALLGTSLRQGHRRLLPLAIFLGGLGLVAFIYFNHLVLTQQLNFYAFISVRLVSGVALALFAGLALGLSELAWAVARLLQPRQQRRWGLPFVLLVPWVIYSQFTAGYNFAKWMGKWQPAPHRTPIFLSEAEARYDLTQIWQVMADTPGRVLFTSHYALLFDFPTSLKAATPVLTGREIIGGVFTHHTPVSTYLWAGTADVPTMWGKVETTDDRSLAGIPWEAMTDDFFYDLARRFNTTLIVTTAADHRARAFLDAAPHFQPVWSNGLFTFYGVQDYEPSYVEADQAVARVIRYDRRAIDVQVADAAPGAKLLVKVSYYPLWQAEAGGQPVPVEQGSDGLMSLSLPPDSYTLHLRYQPGWPEQLGELLSLVTAVGLIGAAAVYLTLLLRKIIPRHLHRSASAGVHLRHSG